MAADFLARQRAEVNDSGTDYADSVYNNYRDDALRRISRAAPFDTSASLAIVSGTMSYARPPDFVTMSTTEYLPSLGLASSTFLDLSLIPKYRIEDATGGFFVLDKHFSLFGTSIVFKNDPHVTATWTIYYGGTYVITGLPDDWIEMALDYATAKIFDLKASAAAAHFDYSLSGTSISGKASESSRWKTLRDERMERFNSEVQRIATEESPYGTFRIDRA